MKKKAIIAVFVAGVLAMSAHTGIYETTYAAEQNSAEQRSFAQESAEQESAEKHALCESACFSECCGCSVPVKYMGHFTATAYCSCCNCSEGYGNLTATGGECHEGTIAVDPEVIPLGSTVYIEFADGSIKECIAEDVGGAIKGKMVDIFMSDHATAEEFGRQQVKVYIERK